MSKLTLIIVNYNSSKNTNKLLLSIKKNIKKLTKKSKQNIKYRENDYKKIIIQQKLLKNLFVLFEEMDLRSLEYKIVLSERSIRKKIMRYFEFREKRDGSSSFCIEGSRQDFADYLSVDKSALSRELNKMKKDGLIDFNGDNFTILQKL